MGEFGKTYDICAQRVEDLFIEVTSVNEEATSGYDSDTGDSVHMGWKENLAWRQRGDSFFNSDSESLGGSADWSPARLLGRRRFEMGESCDSGGRGDQLFDDEMEESRDQSPGSVSNDTNGSDTPSPAHLALPKRNTVNRKVFSSGKEIHQEAINKDSIEGFRKRTKEGDAKMRGRIPGGNTGFKVRPKSNFPPTLRDAQMSDVVTPFISA